MGANYNDLYKWKLKNPSQKGFTANRNNSNSTNSSARSVNTNSRIVLKPLVKRSSSLRDLSEKSQSQSSLVGAGGGSNSGSRIGSSRLIDTSEVDDNYVENLLAEAQAIVIYESKPVEKADINKLVNEKNVDLLSDLNLSDSNLQKIIEKKILKKFKNLKSIDLSCNQIKFIENLDENVNLVELKLYANQIEVIENLDTLRQLTSLLLNSNKIERIGRGLNELRQLKLLRLDDNQIKSIQFNELSSCSNLVHLNVSRNELNSLKFVNSLPNLEELIASHLNLEQIDFDTSRCKKITELDLSYNKLTDNAIQTLGYLRSLTMLNLSNNCLSSLANVALVRNLRSVNVSHNLIKTLEEFKQLGELESLNASNNKITDWFQIEVLIHCRELVELDVRDNPIMEGKSVQDIQLALPNIEFANTLPLRYYEDAGISQADLKRYDADVERNIAMHKQIVQFDNEMNVMSENFLRKLKEVTETLNSIEKKIDTPTTTTNSGAPTLQKSPSTASMTRSTSSHGRLHDALSFSKNYKKSN